MYRKKVLKVWIKMHAHMIFELLIIPLKILILILVPIICFIATFINTKSIKKTKELLDNYMWKEAYNVLLDNENYMHYWYRM